MAPSWTWRLDGQHVTLTHTLSAFYTISFNFSESRSPEIRDRTG
jgi:hypothetical protein